MCDPRESKQSATISVLVANKFGALARIAGLFSGRGYNIESLSVNHTHDQTKSRMIIVTNGTADVLEQIRKQLNKLIDVIEVEDVSALTHIERVRALIKVRAPREKRGEIIQLIQTFHGEVLKIEDGILWTEVAGAPARIDEFTSLMEDYGIVEIARAGRTAIRID